MLYLIGGAARAGKTLLAHRLLREHNTPYFCADYFVSALEQGAPELGIESEAPNAVRARLFWPRIAPMLRNIVEVEPAYTVEGDALLPAGVASLCAAYPGLVRACFVGYADTTAERKMAEIRTFGGNVNDWIQHHTDDYVLKLCREMIQFSQLVRVECAARGLPYFDVSVTFLETLDAAYSMLIAPR